MIIHKILGRLHTVPREKRLDTVSFEWFEQNSHILKKTASSGEEIGLRLDEPLTDGGVLYEDENRILALSLTPCEIICVAAASMEEMGRICFELGNRHLPLAIHESYVQTPYDAPALEYLQKLGFCCETIIAKFTPSVVVRGHGHG